MRISDWSSDVCSSDLPMQIIHHNLPSSVSIAKLFLVLPDAGPIPGSTEAESIVIGALNATSGDRRAAWNMTDAVDDDCSRPMQIGRETGRERVVSTLRSRWCRVHKKKKKKTIN